MKKMMPLKNAKAVTVHLVVDKHIENSTKIKDRKIRGGRNSMRLHVTGFGQTMPSQRINRI